MSDTPTPADYALTPAEQAKLIEQDWTAELAKLEAANAERAAALAGEDWPPAT